MIKISPKIILILVVIFFLITRLYKISEIPVSVYWDEASIGYNAYSIIQTGKDEWGDFLPLHLRAFGEFKLPVYVYSVVISEFVFGLNEFAVRIPAVLYSLGVVLVTYLLTKKIFDVKTALWSSFFVTIIPWFFIFSRTGYEATAGLMFYLLGIYLFLLYKRSALFIFIAVISFIISIYSYNSFRVIIPLTLIILGIYEAHNLLQNKNSWKVGVLSLIIFLVSWIPIYRLYVFDTGAIRAKAVAETKIENLFSNYFSHFSPNFLLIEGDKNLRSHIGYFGQLSLPIFIFFVIGLFEILKVRSKYRFLILSFLLISPIAATLTKESPHSLRAISAVPFISIIGAFGVIYSERFFKKESFFNIGLITICLLFFLNYLFNFSTEYPNKSSQDWQFAYKKIFARYKEDAPKTNKFIVSDEYGQPYIFALFYLKYDPEKFREEVVRSDVSDWGFSTVEQFNGFFFSKIPK